MSCINHTEFKNHRRIIAINDNLIENHQFLLPNVEFFFFNNSNDEIFIHQAYKIAKNQEINFETFAKFNKTSKKFKKLSKVQSIIERRRNFNGLMLNASMVITNSETLSFFNDSNYKHIDTITKVNYQLTNRVIEWLNASCSYQVVELSEVFSEKFKRI